MKRTFIFSTILVLAIAVLPLCADAQTYEFLVNDLPFIRTVDEGDGLAGYLSAFFKFGLAIAVTLSVVMFTFNGVRYMTSDRVGGKEGAKGGMRASVLGLILAFSAWLVLRTINPALVDFQLFKTIQEVRELLDTNIEQQTPGPSATTTPTEGMPESELAAREALKALGVGINRDNACPPNSSGQGCTNVADLPHVLINFLGVMANDIGRCPEGRSDASCPVVVTGGTEPGHATHGPGRAIVDIRWSSQTVNWVASNAQKCAARHTLGDVWIVRNRNTYFLDEVGGARHWHICMDRGGYCGEFVRLCQTVHEN